MAGRQTEPPADLLVGPAHSDSATTFTPGSTPARRISSRSGVVASAESERRMRRLSLTKTPSPWRPTRRPSNWRSRTVRRTVIALTWNSRTRSASLGMRDPGP